MVWGMAKTVVGATAAIIHPAHAIGRINGPSRSVNASTVHERQGTATDSFTP
ncbi:hypothetical protein D3C73_1386150 [compost metagenome]